MATVYSATDLRHGRRVAVKVMRPELAAAVGGERFLREVRIAASLAHPNIVPLFDSGAAGDILFYVMPLVEGESLRARLDREQQLPVGVALDIARDVAAGLGHAHARRTSCWSRARRSSPISASPGRSTRAPSA